MLSYLKAFFVLNIIGAIIIGGVLLYRQIPCAVDLKEALVNKDGQAFVSMAIGGC